MALRLVASNDLITQGVPLKLRMALEVSPSITVAGDEVLTPKAVVQMAREQHLRIPANIRQKFGMTDKLPIAGIRCDGDVRAPHPWDIKVSVMVQQTWIYACNADDFLSSMFDFERPAYELYRHWGDADWHPRSVMSVHVRAENRMPVWLRNTCRYRTWAELVVEQESPNWLQGIYERSP